MLQVTLMNGQTVQANRLDARDIINALDSNLRYRPSSREWGFIMITNRMKKAAVLKRARIKAMILHRG